MSPIEQKAFAARAAAHLLATVDTATKNQVLIALADRLIAARDVILAANATDMQRSREAGLAAPKLKRLAITDPVLTQMADGLRQIAQLPDPVGVVVRETMTSDRLQVKKVRVPLGVIAMIYESRPNVTIDAFGLCFKAGNACFLKGGKEAADTNGALATLAREVLQAAGLPVSAVEVMTSSDREEIRELLTLDQYIDLVIPRGGTQLIQFVHEHSRIPMVQHFHGVCHVYVDEFADLDKATQICVTAKISAPATCNATECVLVHAAVADAFVPRVGAELAAAGVEIRGDAGVQQRLAAAIPAKEDDWGTEYLDLVLAMKVVPDLAAATAHIQRYGSNHTDAIISANTERVAEFMNAVGSSCVLANASTRFNDGYSLGLGAEIGISTSKIHAYGPMGLEELTTQRYVVFGTGQTR